ncbi:MAG: hypothetical protein HUJ30_08315 [Gammaproteobacteria bacterium]|nr:hypothetical protein [Gammaproteobacteria bacterium]
MADLTELLQWEDGIYQLETTDPVVGGAAGISNQQGKQLANRTAYLRALAGDNVTTITAAGSPFTLTTGLTGLVIVDASAGNVVLNLPAASALKTMPFVIYRQDATANTVTLTPDGTDTVDGSASYLVQPGARVHFISDGTSDWSRTSADEATQAEVDAGAVEGKYVSPKKLRFGFSISLNSNGYIAFPSWLGGLILQWGNATVSASSSLLVTLPLAYPTANLLALAGDGAAANADGSVAADTLTTTTITLNNSSTQNSLVYWISIGH